MPAKRKRDDAALLRSLGQGQIAPDYTGGPNAGGYRLGFNRPDVQQPGTQLYDALGANPQLGPRMNTLGPGGNAAGNSQAPGGGFPWQARAPYQEPAGPTQLADANAAIGSMEGIPTDFGQYKDAGRQQQLASGMKGLADLPAWHGPSNSPNTSQQLTYAATLKNLHANKSESAKAYDQELAQRKERVLANAAAGYRPSDNSPQTGIGRLLLAEMIKGGQGGQGAAGDLQQGMGQNGPTGLAGMTPRMQQLWAIQNPVAFAHIMGKTPDLAGQAAMIEARAKADALAQNPNGLMPDALMNVEAEKAFNEGRFEAVHHGHMKAKVDAMQNMPTVGSLPWQSSRAEHKAEVMKRIGLLHGKIDKKKLSDWYDATYGAPGTGNGGGALNSSIPVFNNRQVPPMA